MQPEGFECFGKSEAGGLACLVEGDAVLDEGDDEARDGSGGAVEGVGEGEGAGGDGSGCAGCCREGLRAVADVQASRLLVCAIG